MLVRRRLAAPPLVDPSLPCAYRVVLYKRATKAQRGTLADIFSQSRRILSETVGAYLGYVTAASEKSNAEFGKIAKREGFGLYDQVTKRARWMPWRQKAMKDV